MLEANLIFLRRIIDGNIASPELLTQINLKVSTFNERHNILVFFTYVQHQLFKKPTIT